MQFQPIRRNKMFSGNKAGLFSKTGRGRTTKWAVTLFLGAVSLTIIMIAAWVTHVVVCIKTASWLLLIVGAIVFPVGIIHGIGSWLGVF
jgi:hypothetical protein